MQPVYQPKSQHEAAQRGSHSFLSQHGFPPNERLACFVSTSSLTGKDKLELESCELDLPASDVLPVLAVFLDVTLLDFWVLMFLKSCQYVNLPNYLYLYFIYVFLKMEMQLFKWVWFLLLSNSAIAIMQFLCVMFQETLHFSCVAFWKCCHHFEYNLTSLQL